MHKFISVSPLILGANVLSASASQLTLTDMGIMIHHIVSIKEYRVRSVSTTIGNNYDLLCLPSMLNKFTNTWRRHQMKAVSALLDFCEGNSPVTGEFPSQRPVTRSFDVFFDLRPNKWLSKPSRLWWFETPSRSLWRHRNGLAAIQSQLNYG